MRTLVLTLAATAALGSATAAFAQMQTSNEGPSGAITQPAGSGFYQSSVGNTHGSGEDRYDLAIMMLKKKVDRVTREDGGKLTPEHLTSLQAELDRLNGGFSRHRRASFGHHDAAPGPPSSSSASSD